MWIEMFVIKFEGKIENVRGNAENIFNFTREFNEKHFFPFKKNSRKFFLEELPTSGHCFLK